jgi:flagellar hook assembly protein FlgD
LVKEVASEKSMNADANLVRWNGQDDEGSTVPDGLYVVSVEALGEKQVRTLAVVR